MARHTITEKELDDHLRTPQWETFAASYNNVSNKRFQIDAGPGGHVFKVMDRGETKFLGADRIAAIAAYNEAP